MTFIESFRIAWEALVSNKIRALLTMLGIVIGVGSVIGMLAIGNGLLAVVQQDFDSLGVGVFTVTPSINSTESGETARPRLTAADAEALLSSPITTAVKQVAVQYSSQAIVTAPGRDKFYYSTNSVSPSYFAIGDNPLSVGSYFTDSDNTSRARVAVIGSEVATTLFGTERDAWGQQILINGIYFEVIGILEGASAEGASFSSATSTVFVPYLTGRARLFRNNITPRVDINSITVQATSREQIDTAIAQVEELLRQRHNISPNAVDDFSVNNPEDLLETINTVFAGFNAFLGLIAGIALLVGGIGIMNIMLVSVTQRTREIGLRKAVGARRSAILQQFMIEALVICLLGCLLGVSFGYLMSFAGTYVIRNVFFVPGASAVVSMSSIVLSIGISTFIGLVFGFWPAWRASRLLPVQALRSD
jgi:putative ABC transport system permease protein